MTPQQLKNSILQLAGQGKLVEQRPEEGTGEELYKQIQIEKQRLIKEGRIDKEKPQKTIQEEDLQFDIPDSWTWVRLDSVYQHNTGKALNGKELNGKLLEYITTSNLYWNRFELGTLKKMSFTESEIEKCTVKKGDLLVCEGGDFGRAAIWKYDFNVRIQNHVHRLRPYAPLCTEFFYYLFYLYKHVGWIGGKGIGIQGLSSNALGNLVFPLPPLGEQQRIVAKIEELMPLVEQYEVAYNKLENLNKKFPEDMQKAILQYAVQGKLVEQRPEEGTGEELYKQIQAEKQRLIKEGKIKKEKPLEEIKEDEIPFDIPDSWKWVRFGSISSIIHYGYTASASAFGNTKLLRITDIQNDSVLWSTVPFCEIRNEDLPKYQLNNRDILIARTGGTVGKSYIVRNLHETAVFASYLIRIVPMNEINEEYVKLFMGTPLYWNQLKEAAIGTGQPNVNSQALNRLLIPIPPLEEQKRIVAKIEELMPLVELLKRETLY